MTAAIYIRVSGKRQDEENQRADCERLAATRGWALDGNGPHREIGSAVKNRPVWRGILARAHRGEISAVIVWSLDRMGRDMFGILSDWRALRAVGCKLASTREPWLGSDLGEVEELLMAQMAWAAQFERRRMLERVRMAHDRIRRDLAETGQHVTAAGKTIRRFGRPNSLTPEMKEKIRTSRAKGVSISAIAYSWGVARATIRAALKPLAESESTK